MTERSIETECHGRYGAALYHGALGSRGRYIIMGDADDGYDFRRLDPFVEKLRQGRDKSRRAGPRGADSAFSEYP